MLGHRRRRRAGRRGGGADRLARYTLRSVGQLTGDPSRAMDQLNATLRDQPEMSLVTAVCAHLRAAEDPERSRGGCSWPTPAIPATAARTRRRPRARAGVGARWPARSTTGPGRAPRSTLAAGDTLAALHGRRDRHCRRSAARFGEERLLDCAARRPAGPAEPDALVTALDAALDAFRHGPQRDDTAIAAVRSRACRRGRTARSRGSVATAPLASANGQAIWGCGRRVAQREDPADHRDALDRGAGIDEHAPRSVPGDADHLAQRTRGAALGRERDGREAFPACSPRLVAGRAGTRRRRIWLTMQR